MSTPEVQPSPPAAPVKVAGLHPLRWAPFAGVSVLFDGAFEAAGSVAGDALAPLDNGLCQPESPLALYGALRRTLDELMAQSGGDPSLGGIADWTFAPLPLASYHVTAWDGINVANLSAVREPQQAEWACFLHALAVGALSDAAPATAALRAHPSANWRGRLALSVQGLSLWGDQVLVARLTPADADSLTAYSAWLEQRRALGAWAAAAWGLPPAPDPQLHVSLGYFMQAAGAQLFAAQLPHWQRQMCDAASGLPVVFTSSSVHVFTDMARFYPLAALLQSR